MVVVDTMGDLDAIYAAADLVVVGGSFGRWRGHNFLEPAWHGKPVLCGPDMADFAADASLFLRDGALLQVADASELRAAFSELAANPDAAREMGARARALAASGQGVSRKLAEEIAEDLARTKPERAVGEGLVASRAQAEPSHAPAPGAVFRGPASSLRVLVAVGSSGLGGGERHAVTLARELRDSGLADPTLACRGGGWLEAQARAAKLPIVTLPFLQGPDPFTVAGLARWLCVGGFDLLHTHLNWASFLGGLAAPLAGVPCVATVHGLSRAGYYRTAERLIAVSETVRRRLVRSLGDGQPIDLVYTGLPPIPAPDSRRLTALRDRLGLSAAEPVFTVIGKFHRNKNQRLLLEAARLLPASEAWRVMLVGAGPEEPALREVAALLGDRVAFAGEIDDVSTVLGASSLVVVPSLEEAFGLVALEAQMAGVPVAASRTGGLEELVEDGVSGRQFEPGDARGLASILGDYLSDPGSFVPLSRAARDASARFSPAAMARATCAVYEATLEQVRVR
ncbi:MAG: glycosyltransferase [Candidatus Wallbacteria bacterium]|nr:glycosyltransferase [Candidatus Wallbacteria bacterium]